MQTKRIIVFVVSAVAGVLADLGLIYGLFATTPEKFAQWITARQQASNKLDMTAYKKLAKPSEGNQVEYFSLVDKNLFGNVIMGYMMPMDHMQAMNMKDKEEEPDTEVDS